MPGRLAQFLRIEYKRTAVVFMHAALSLVIMAAAVMACAYAGAYMLRKYALYEPPDVALVVDDDSAYLDVAIRLIGSMDTVSSVCTLKPMDESAAMDGLSRGELAGVIILSEDFYEDINTGVNTPARVLLPEGSDSLLRELLQAGVSMVDTAEAGIYAVTDASRVYEMKLSRGEMESLLTRMYTEAALGRAAFFERRISSPFGDIQEKDYYTGAAMACILIMTGFYFGYLYSGRSRVVERGLRVYGIGPAAAGAAHILIMTTVLMIIAVLARFAIRFAMVRLDLRPGRIFFSDILCLIPACLSVASYFHLVFSLGHNAGTQRVVMLLADLIMLVTGGVVVPTAFFPEWLRGIAEKTPVSVWTAFFAQSAAGSISAGSWLMVLLYAVVMAAAGMGLQWSER